MGLKEIYEMARQKNMCVLVVEDDNALAAEFKGLLEELDFKVDIACNGVEAINKYVSYYNEKQKYYDIVISDINMPLMNGVQLVEKIFDENSEQVVIVVSANRDSEQLIPLINMKVEQFIRKPIDFEEFIYSLDNALRKLLEASEIGEAKLQSTVDLGNGICWYQEDALLLKQGEHVKLTHNEQLLLKLLLKTPNRVYSNEDICSHLGNNGLNADSIKHLVLRLRKKIPKGLVESVYGVGYKAVC